MYNFLVGFTFECLEIDDSENLIVHFLSDGKFSSLDKFFKEAVRINHIFIDFMVDTRFFLSETKTQAENKSYITYQIRDEFAQIQLMTQHIPSITPPDSYNEKGGTKTGKKATKKIKNGTSKATYSKKTIQYLNVAGKKKMKINKKAIALIVSLVESGHGAIKNQAQISQMALRIKNEKNPALEVKIDYY